MLTRISFPSPIIRVILLVLTAVVLMSYSFYAGGSMAKRYAPMINAVMHIKVEVSAAHLWLEEIVSGDSQLRISNVWGHLDTAENIVQTIYDGGVFRGQVYQKLTDPRLISYVDGIRISVSNFRAIAENRWSTIALSGAGSLVDKELDDTFNVLFATTTAAETMLQSKMSTRLRHFENIQIFLVLMVIVFGARVAYVLYVHEHRRANDLESLKLQESSLRASEKRYQTLFKKTNDAIFVIDKTTGYYSDANDSALALTGLTLQELKQHYFRDLIPDIKKEMLESVIDSDDAIDLGITEYTRRDGEMRFARLSAIPLDEFCVIGIARDITDEYLAEQHLQRAHKMDAIGQISGGIAHDFNNILGVIMGNLDLLELEQGINSEAQKRFNTVRDCSRRAAKLTKQLLGFSREHHSEVVTSDINQIISDMSNLIERSVTPEVEVCYRLGEGVVHSKIDSEEFKDALLNLILNARDAMEGNGKLIIRTADVKLDENYCRQNPDISPGAYLEVAVSDFGSGMSMAVQEKIFEPFFTTKPVGKGTGLGLSMVYGFVKRSSAHIRVSSVLGRGSTFYLYLPAAAEHVAEKSSLRPVGRHSLPSGTERVLVVDDEEGLRLVAQEFLENLGYQVIIAKNGVNALNILELNPDVDVVFSDVVMPGGVNGYQLAQKVARRYPAIKLLLTSGYAEHKDGQNIYEDELLLKPYTQSDLAKRLRKILDSVDVLAPVEVEPEAVS